MALKDGKPAKLQVTERVQSGLSEKESVSLLLRLPKQVGSQVKRSVWRKLLLKSISSLESRGNVEDQCDPEVISFKFFHQNDWGGEFGNYASSILVEQLKLADSGNLEMQDNKAFEEGAVYRFTMM